jgi:hypothetical protein
MSDYTIWGENDVQLHGPSWGRRVIQHIQCAADDKYQYTQTHKAGQFREQHEDALSHSVSTSSMNILLVVVAS